ncbi:MAG: SDR family NAD(P)-dependent oxidoreductase [Pseudomonadota bacterium]
MATVTIIGGSKGIGLETVKRALEMGHQVTAFARSASKIRISDDRLKKIDGDALNPVDVEAAVANADVVIQALGVPFNLKLFTGPITLFSEATRILIPALESSGVKRLIAVTGYGAGDSEATIHPLQKAPFNLVFGRAYSDKSVQERLIRQSGSDWVIARPGVLSNGLKTETYEIITEYDQMRNGVISRADVAHFLVGQIDSDAYVGQAPVLRDGLFVAA